MALGYTTQGWSPELTPWKDEIKRVEIANLIATLHNSGSIFFTRSSDGVLLHYEIAPKEQKEERFEELLKEWR
jgi:hypothetical protein